MTDDSARPVRYRCAGRDEWMLVQRGSLGSHVLLIQPFFAELNRSRRLLRDIMRRLACRGVGSSLPDLPGTGESPRALADCGWEDWRRAVVAASAVVAENGGSVPHVAGFRGGALLDGVIAARSHWRLAPVAGAAVLRELARARAIGDAEAGRAPDSGEQPTQWAGYRLSPDLVAGLSDARPAAVAPVRVVRVEGDAREADSMIAGPALWRRAEPGHSTALAEALAANLAEWIARCDA